MIKSFLVSNNEYIQTGLVEVQPAPPGPRTVGIQIARGGKEVLPAHQQPIAGRHGLTVDDDGGRLDSMHDSSLSAMAQSLSTPNAVIPTMRGEGHNRIVPSHNLSTDPSHNVPNSTSELAVSAKRLHPYEHLTGISRERPEIIMVTDFQPLYNAPSATEHHAKLTYSSNQSKHLQTPAGVFFDHQVDIRNLRFHNIKQLLAANKRAASNYRKLMSQRHSKFTSEINNLNAASYYLWNLMASLERLKQQLDIRDAVHKVDPFQVLRDHLADHSKVRSRQYLEQLTTSLNSYFTKEYDIHHVLNMYGFPTDHTKHVFCSTKLWLQNLLELKYVLQSHSLLMLDQGSPQHKLDYSPVKLLSTPDIKRFKYTEISQKLPNLSTLMSLRPTDIQSTVQSMINSYGTIYESIHFRNEEMRIAGLINMISREYRYSRALGNKDVQRILSTYYGFAENQQNNHRVFDYVLGQFGNNISDVPFTQTNALTSIAQRLVSKSVAVLPLESRYVEGDVGTLTPGSEYYIDPVLETDGKTYNVSRLTEFAGSIADSEKAFHTIVNWFNLTSSEYVDEHSHEAGSLETILNNSRMLFNEFRKGFIGDNGIPLPMVQKDVMTPVFAMAHTDNRIKALLFTYVVLRTARMYFPSMSQNSSAGAQDNTSASDAIIELLRKELISKSKGFTAFKAAADTKYKLGAAKKADSNVTSSYGNSTLIRIESIVTAMKASNALLGAVDLMVSKLITAFKESDPDLGAAFNGDRTRYGNHIDTMVIMTAFDVMTSIISSYGGRKIVGFHIDKGQDSLVVQDSVNNHTSSMHDIDGRLAREISLAQHSVFLVFNTLRKLHDSIVNVTNYVNSPSSLKELRRISSLFDDMNMLHMLFSEQQIMLFASTVSDIVSAFKSEAMAGLAPDDPNGDGKFDADDEIKALDDEVISPKVRTAIERVFLHSQYTSVSALSLKIMTVGIPMGFARHLQQRVDVKKLKKTSFDVRQDDVIKVKVYKVDERHPDVIYKPKDFLFELSRFPVRNDKYIKQNAGNGSILQTVRRFATRDFSQTFVEGGSAVQYLQPQKGETEALGGQDYSFLTKNEKEQLYTNHVMSYMLEAYLKIMTGVSTADHNFDIVPAQQYVDPAFVSHTLQHHLNNFIDTKSAQKNDDDNVHHGGLFFSTTNNSSGAPSRGRFSERGATGGSSNPDESTANSAGVSGMSTMGALSSAHDDIPNTRNEEQQSRSTTTALSSISSQHVPTVMHMMGVVSEFSRMLTPMSDPLVVSKRLIMPKQFDRVFNLMIDPYSFEIDVEKTNKTPHGKQALELLLKKGEVIPAPVATLLHKSSRNSMKKYVPRRRSTVEGDLTFEKYIVAVETVGDEEV